MTLRVEAIGSKEAARLVVEHHYLHRRPPISFAYGLVHNGQVVGAVTFGTPASRHMQIGAYPEHPEKVTELNRLWVHDDMPNGSESWFVSRALKVLPPRIVLSYADTARGHMGYVYRALNFYYAGWTDMERRMPRLDYIPAKGDVHSREAFRSGVSHTVRRKPKVKYWTTTGNRADRKELTAACQWPRLCWHEYPPPRNGHKQLVLMKEGMK